MKRVIKLDEIILAIGAFVMIFTIGMYIGGIGINESEEFVDKATGYLVGHDDERYVNITKLSTEEFNEYIDSRYEEIKQEKGWVK